MIRKLASDIRKIVVSYLPFIGLPRSTLSDEPSDSDEP